MRKSTKKRLKKWSGYFIIFLIFLTIFFSFDRYLKPRFGPGGVGPPLVSFVEPAPLDNMGLEGDSIEINVSIIEPNLNELKFNWNETNYISYDNSLLLMFNLDNRSELGENDTHVKDLSRYGNNGSVYRAVWNSSGRYGGAYEFSDNEELSDHSYIRVEHSDPYVPYSLDIVNGKEVSYFAWVKSNKELNDLGSVWDSYVLFKPRNSFLLGWAGWSHDGWECNIWNQSDVNQRVAVWKTRELIKDEWIQAGCVFNGTFLGLYINGNLEAFDNNISGYVIQNYSGAEYYDLFIGAKNQFASGGMTWNGSIDEVRIWNKSLTDEEIRWNYYSNLQKYDNEKWNLYINKSNLANGSYSYQAIASNSNEERGMSEKRQINIGIDNEKPNLRVLPFSNNLVVSNFILNISSSDNLEEHSTFMDFNKDLVLWMRMDDVDEMGNILDRSSYGNYGTSSNLLGNGNFEASNDEFNVYGTPASWGYSNSDAKIGNYSMRVIAASLTFCTVNYCGIQRTIPAQTPGEFYNVSFWIKGISNIGSVHFSFQNGAGDENELSYSVILDNQWRFYSNSVSVSSSKNTLYIWSENPDQEFLVDGLKLEKVGRNKVDVDVIGKYGKGAEFDGIDDYINLGVPSVLNTDIDDVTISAWVKVNANLGDRSTNYEIFTNEYFRKYGYLFRVEDNVAPGNPGIIHFRTSRDGDDSQLSTPSLTYPNDKKWHHVVAVKNGTNAFIYLDGVQVTFGTGFLSPADSPDASKISGLYQPMNGTIDDIQIYKRALSKEEILSLFNADLYKYERNLTLDDGSYELGIYAQDLAGNVNEVLRKIVVDSRIPKISLGAMPEKINVGEELLINASINSTSKLGDIVLKRKDASAIEDSAIFRLGFDKRWGLGENDSHVVDSVNGIGGSVYEAKWGGGKFRGGYEFDGLGDYIIVEDNDNLDFNDKDSFSLALWIKPNLWNRFYNNIICKGDGSIEYNYCLYVRNDEIVVGGGSYSGISNPLSLGRWQHLLVVYNGNSFRFYLDGNYVNETWGYINNATDFPLYIGWNNFPLQFFNGSIDEIMIWDRGLSAEEVEKIYLLEREMFYDDSFLLMLNFENRSELGENDTYVKDLSRYGNNGSVYGAGWTASGKHGGAFSFDGIDDYINLSNQEFLNQDFKELTIAFWMFANSTTSSDAGLVGKGTAIYGTTYHTNSGVYFYIREGANHVSAEVLPNKWHYIVGTFNGSSLRLYVDRELVVAKDDFIYSSTGTGLEFYIGRSDFLYNSYFNGRIDDVRIFDRELSKEEIEGLYYSYLDKAKSIGEEWNLEIRKNLSEGVYDYMVCARNALDEGCSEKKRVSVAREEIVVVPPGDGNGGGGGGGGGGIVSKPKAQNITNQSENVSKIDVKKIVLNEEKIEFLDIGASEVVVISMNNQIYKISFRIDENGVILIGENGEFLIPRDDILLVLLGGEEVYIGVKRIDADGAGIVLGLDMEQVMGEVKEEEDGGEIEKTGVNKVYYIGGIIAIILAIGIVVKYLISIFKMKKEKEALDKIAGFSREEKEEKLEGVVLKKREE